MLNIWLLGCTSKMGSESFDSSELAVLGAIRDTAYKSPDGKCSLPVSEIAGLWK